MRIYLPHEAPKTSIRGYRGNKRRRTFTKITLFMFFFSVLIIVGAVMLFMAIPWKVAIGGALTAAGVSTLKAAL